MNTDQGHLFLKAVDKIAACLDKGVQFGGSEMLQSISDNLAEIKIKLGDVDRKLDQNIKETIINMESIKNLKEHLHELEYDRKADMKEVDKKIKDAKKEAIETSSKNAMIKFYSLLVTSITGLLAGLGALLTILKVKL